MKFFSLKLINFYKNNENTDPLIVSKSIYFTIKPRKNYFNNIIKFFIKNGLKKKIKIELLKSLNFFFFFFNSNNTQYHDLQKSIDILKNSLFLNFNFFKINFILEFLINLIAPVFDIVCYNKPIKNKNKKKTEINYFFKLKYLNLESRQKRALK